MGFWTTKSNQNVPAPVPPAIVVDVGRYIGVGGLLVIPTALTGGIVAVTIYSSPAFGVGQGVAFSSLSMTPGDWRDVNGSVNIGLTISGSSFTVSTGTGNGPNQAGFAYDWIAWGNP